MGDYHLPNTVAYALVGEERADDNRMQELLEEFRPHRGRIVQLVRAAHVAAPKYGPRSAVRSFEESQTPGGFPVSGIRNPVSGA